MTCLESSLVRMATRSDPAPSAMANNHSCQFWVDTLKNLLMGVTMMITCMSQAVQGMIAIPIRPVLETTQLHQGQRAFAYARISLSTCYASG